ncbi:hypothetical protein [Neomesorhizobium albiziae]|uniref:hypothetical protein n=2 Tax=Neomesorhizobium albiziae TaxID=335020 RepID=UPI00165FD9F4|nr:hypothetical protein [Mesorhizobium albiziae]
MKAGRNGHFMGEPKAGTIVQRQADLVKFCFFAKKFGSLLPETVDLCVMMAAKPRKPGDTK